MSFLNQYTKISESSHFYYSSKSVGDYVYSVGSCGSLEQNAPRYGLVTKTDLDGNVIWERKFRDDQNNRDSYFRLFVGCDNGDIIITDVNWDGTLDNNYRLVRVSASGNFVWSKTFLAAGEFYFRDLVNIIRIGNESYLVHRRDINGNFADETHMLYKIDGSGNIVIQKNIKTNEGHVTISNIVYDSNKIMVYGARHLEDASAYTGWIKDGLVLELSQNLTVVNKFLVGDRYLSISNGKISGSNLIIFGHIETGSGGTPLAYIGKIPMPANPSPTLYLDVISSEFHYDLAYFNNQFIYLYSIQRFNTYTTKLDHNLNVLWTKDFDPGNFVYPGLLNQINSNSINVVSTRYIDQYGYNPVVGLLDLDLNSCLTVPGPPFSKGPKGFSIHLEIQILLNPTDHTLDTETYSADEVTSEKIEVCPTIPDDPCIKDKTLCELYTQIYDIYANCRLVAPDWENTKLDFKALAACEEHIMKLIETFIKNHPEYNLQEIFDKKLESIKIFITKPNFETYVASWDAIQSILDYLSQTGNCECNNNIKINEFTSLQSSHFYLQAAGSHGIDSFKGMLLRWALKGKLSSHLPKGNYASTLVNFNKPDDFVKIYRAPYVQQTATLDFSIPPNSVNDSGHFWIYVVNGSSYVDGAQVQYMFYVYFRNSERYTTTRSLYNPATETLEFLAKYGKELIEIENKTDLSFAVSPYFNIQDSGYVSVELLSVEENKVTAPKAASLRRKYDTAELNETKLLSENIRSIRFQSHNAFIERIRFEVYSDFINATSNVNGWTFLGKHALTTDTSIAFQRLEPVPDCLTKWLRYNDDAFVKADNYKEKWNSASLEDGFRIIDTVQDYISLSNAADNPEANELVEVNDQPAGSEDFVISNMHLLQLGSLDFHIARMLGLGLLDLDDQLGEEKFVYLASYTTVADLQDGLGPRKVEHMYCSLPTDIYDSRLPLAVDLTAPQPGVISSQDIEAEPILTDEDGYSHDGRTRFLTLFNQSLPEEILNAPFYYQDYEFSSADTTIPVYAGLEYRKTAPQNEPAFPWVKPELAYDRNFYNLDDTVDEILKNETKSILIPEPGFPLFVHREKQNGYHDYSSYGINWFSRATSSIIIWSLETILRPFNTLLPPTNINATLIQKENPLLLTSALEQEMLTQITDNDNEDDKTLVRLTFEYNHGQELIDYHKAIDGEIVSGYQLLPEEQELFAENIQMFFKSEIPHSVSGTIIDVDDSDPLLAVITTGPFPIVSAGQDEDGEWNEEIVPELAPGLVNNFIGGVFSINGDEYIIHQINLSVAYPEFTVFKRDVSGRLVDSLDAAIPEDGLLAPETGGIFIAIENMLNEISWNAPAQLLEINIDMIDVHEEEITIYNQDNSNETHFQRFRGVYDYTTIEKIYENVPDPNGTDANLDGETDLISAHRGLYKVTFQDYALPVHTQYHPDINYSVEWYNGVARIHTLGHANEPRKEFRVYKAENIDDKLTLLVSDLGFPNNVEDIADYQEKLMPDNVNIINNQLVNFYPGYKVYLRKNIPYGLTEGNIMPENEDETKYSVFGLRSHDIALGYTSKISTPTLMFARPLVGPKKPKEPLGGKFATRPDFFGKASYTFTNEYEHKPHSVQFNRASDIQILSAIYNKQTVEEVMNVIMLDGNDLFYVNRWNNLLGFNYPLGTFEKFPDDAGVSLPLPNNQDFIDSINVFIADHNDYYDDDIDDIDEIDDLNFPVIPAVTVNGTLRNGELKILDFMRDTIFNCFVPLTEIPVIFDHIKPNAFHPEPYVPINKKQVIRDRDGYLLKPEDPLFDMAPMMVRSYSGGIHKTQFTDFGLDGASKARYFYTVREINIQLQTGEYSKINGPITLVNTAPPTAPEIIKIIPVLENRTLGIQPAIQLQINAYAEVQNIKKINVYRADNATDALTVRTMQLIRIIDIDAAGLTADSRWIVEDDFNDLPEVPFGDPLYYRITVSREIRYADKYGIIQTDYALSEATKMVITNVAENYTPESPVLTYASEPLSTAGNLSYVTLSWNKTAYKAKYHVYKMTSEGAWQEIAIVTSNKDTIYLPLEDTSLLTDMLSTKNGNGDNIYHHFKVLAENTAGMFSRNENVLSIYDPSTWNDIGGIGDMNVEGTFIVRPND